MKKILLLILVSLLLVSCMVGCSKNTTPPQSESEVNGPSEEIIINVPTIPDASAYIAADGTMLRTGDAFPENPVEGDIFQCGNYRYGFKKIYNAEKNMWIPIEEDAWTVHILNEETTIFDECFRKINGKNVIVPSITETPTSKL